MDEHFASNLVEWIPNVSDLVRPRVTESVAVGYTRTSTANHRVIGTSFYHDTHTMCISYSIYISREVLLTLNMESLK